MSAGKGFENASPLTDNNTGRYSIDSVEAPFEPEESLHSTSEHNFDRRWMDSTGQPRYASSTQSFRQQEGGFLSSLSGNTFSNLGGDGINAVGDISTPSMHSGHSMAQSIISTSPRVETAGKRGNEFEYMLNTPSQQLIGSARLARNSLPSQIEEEESAVLSSGPSDEAPTEPTVGSSVDKDTKGDKAAKDIIIPIQVSYSAADAPAGFVFHDEDEGSMDGARDRVERPFDERGNNVIANPLETSISTKGSVSLRSGLSAVQSDQEAKVCSPREGSKSIHSGLSAIQNGSDLEGSASMRSVSVSMKNTGMIENNGNEVGLEEKPLQPKVQTTKGSPFDTIVEADDEEASAAKVADVLSAAPESHKEEVNSTSKEDQDDVDTQSEGLKHVLPASLNVTAKPEKSEEDISVASSKQSSKWRMKMPSLVKSVLAKASPRQEFGQTPKAQIADIGFSTSDEDDDDIFGGLDDDLSKVMGKRQETPSSTKKKAGIVAKASTTPRAPPTSSNRFFNSSHTRKSEPPPTRTSTTPQHRSVRSEARSTPDETKKTPKSGITLKSLRQRLTSPRNAGNRTPVNGDSTNDRSGTEVVEQEMEHVNSDITSSVLGAPLQKKQPQPMPMKTEAEEDRFEKTPKSKTSKNMPTSTKSKAKTPKIDNQSVTDKSAFSKGKDTILDGTAFADETLLDEATRATSAFQESTSEDKGEEPESMFMGLGCGLADAFAVVSKVCNFGKDDEEPEVKTMEDMDEVVTYVSNDATNNSSSHLTELEKRVWNEWDKLDSAFTKAGKTPNSEKSKDKHETKREVARGKLLEIANSAISSQMSKECEQSGASISYSTGTSSDSADTGNSSGITGSSSSEGHTASEGSRSNFSGSDGVSETSKPTTTPILLSFSQRSLIEKFSKQLSQYGVEVLKLNRRMQWQARYFAVSKEQIALIAHEANTKSGAEVAQCPKALLWLKKFSSKSGGYSLTNIDKNGHGGMLLVNLKDIQVSADHQDLKTPLPKKLADKFKDSVMVALEYEFKGEQRRIEFRCKDNDEAQFLSTCMRVIRDLLKREQALRLKTQKKKNKTKN
jgi:hypothetical protein